MSRFLEVYEPTEEGLAKWFMDFFDIKPNEILHNKIPPKEAVAKVLKLFKSNLPKYKCLKKHLRVFAEYDHYANEFAKGPGVCWTAMFAESDPINPDSDEYDRFWKEYTPFERELLKQLGDPSYDIVIDEWCMMLKNNDGRVAKGSK